MDGVVEPAPSKDMLSDLPPLRDVIGHYGLQARKSLGQNFILNMDVTRRIAGAAGDFKDVTVVEIGPGPGGLTRALLERGAKVVAIERDPRCREILAAIQGIMPTCLQIIEGDALEISPQSVVPEGNIKIVANLPYNIGTVLLIQWLSNLERIASLTLMFQKEVARRLFARPQTRDYGRLSVITQWLCDGHRLFDLAPGAFTPAPKVSSSVITLRPKSLGAAEKGLLPVVSTVTRHAFGQRRKMIRSSLKPLFSEEKLADIGLNPCVRAEDLTVADYILLAQSLS